MTPRALVFALASLAACHNGGAPTLHATDATAQAAVPAPPKVFGPAAIDAAIRADWTRLGITPSPRVDDGRFLRRVYLDVIGTVPSPDVVTEFVKDPAPDKRAKVVDRLLASPGYAAYWATTWEDILVGWKTREPIVDRTALREWLEAQFQANAPWDKMVNELLTATGQNSHGGRRQDGAPGTPSDMEEPEDAGAEPINGAVNWFLKYRDAPQDLAGNASRLFLGVQIQCAQCHDHKTEKWKQDDFRKFTACFARTRSEVIDRGKTMGKKRAEVVEIGKPLPRFLKNPELAPLANAQPTALDGTDFSTSGDTRKAVAAWMTSKKNPWFAKAITNRMWGHFLGRGFVDPVDDIRDSNLTTLPALWGQLADDFAAHGDDLKALIRTITATEVYQLTPLPREAPGAAKPASDDGERLWAHFHLTPLGPNELLRSILDVTSLESILARNNRANLDRIRFQLYQRYSFLFDTDEDSEETQFEGTVTQTLALLNGPLVGGGTSAVPGGALDTILAGKGDDESKVTALYLRTLSRAPSAEELAYWVHYVTEPHMVELPDRTHAPPPPPPREPEKKKNGKPKPGKPPGQDALSRLEARDLGFKPDARRQAYSDLFWALLNSSEFTFNH